MATDAFGLVGTRVREYDVIELIGRGGMGAVYRAKHHLLQEERAIKVVARRPAEDQEFTERFIREARVLARLKDEHLVRLYEFWEDQGQLFMALELLRGESVAERLRKRTRLTLVDAVGVARQAAQGLKIAHEGQVVHRDISPDNLQIVKRPDGSEIVKVMDFGIAKALEEVHRELTANLFLGKFEYASPEQCGFGLERGETIDWRSDIYSLGVTLFKMTTGLLPFSAGTPQGYLVKHATERPPAPSRLVPEARLPAELDRVVLRALAKSRGERPQSMAEFIRELDAIPLEPTVAPAATEVIASPATPAATPSPSPATADSRTGRTGGLKMDAAFARKYVIKGRLGEGGMGVVYRAVDTILNEPVALKVISERFLGGPDSVERLKREVVLARRVAHPNVCRIYDIGEADDGTHYVSMEYIEGKPLGRVLREKTVLSLREAIPIVRQVLDALTAAHGANVIHRDLKPDNIMVTPQGHAVIMDFGLSLSEDSQRVTRAGFVIGTPHYMAPEQVTGVNVDSRCDLYALGVILFRMVTGQLPFPSKDTLAVLKAQMETPPPRPSELSSQVPPLLESIILKALEKDPARRFASAESFLNALDPVEPAQIRTSTESGSVIRVPRTGRGRLREATPMEASGSAPTAAPPGGSAPRPTDPEHDKVKAFLSGEDTALGGATAPTEARPDASMTMTEGERPSPRPIQAPPLPARKRRQEPPPAPSPQPAPPRKSMLVPVLGGAAALVLVGAGLGYYIIDGPGSTTTTTTTTISTTISTTRSSSPPATAPTEGPSAFPKMTTSPPPSPPLPSPPTSRITPTPTPRPPTPGPTVTTPPVPTPLPTPVPTPVATPPPAPPPTASPPPRPALSPEQGVRQALREYAAAFSRLDKAAVGSIFPGVPDRAFEDLQRNFKAYDMQIEVQRIEVQSDRNRVVVECRIQHTYTTFSGKRETKAGKERMIFFETNGRWVRIQ